MIRAIGYFQQSAETSLSESLDLVIRLVDQRAKLEELVRGAGQMIDAIAREAGLYMRSPKAAWTLAYDILEAGSFRTSDFCRELGNWIHENFHPEWVLGDAISKGFGLHHGRIPRAIAHVIIDLFNSGELKAILCTSSMIEGVNTAAENVFIYDRHISLNKLDRFTFDNIKGRAGRLFRHKVGKIYLYSPPPEEQRFEVNIPLFDTDSDLAPELLVQIDDDKLSENSRSRKRSITDASLLPPELLKTWARYGVEALNQLADDVSGAFFLNNENYAWKGVPSYPQMEAVMGLAWNRLEFEHHDIRSPAQFAFFSQALRRASGSVRAFLRALVRNSGKEAQPEIDRCLNFIRGAEYSFPQVLRAVNDVVDAVHGPGRVDYRVFAQQLQNLFLLPGLRALDEFGVPTPLAMQLGLRDAENPRVALSTISEQSFAGRARLSHFEQQLLDRGIGLIA